MMGDEVSDTLFSVGSKLQIAAKNGRSTVVTSSLRESSS